MSRENIEKSVAAYFAAFEAMNPESWVKNFADDAVVYDPVGNPPSKPHQDYQKFFQLLSLTLEKLEISPDNVFVCGNSAAVKWTMRVTDKKGQTKTKDGISIFEINDEGKIAQVRAYHYLDQPEPN